MTATTTATATPQENLKKLRHDLNQVFFDRRDTIDLILTAILARSNIYLLGDPGVGKTALVKAIARHTGLQSRYQLFKVDTMPSEFIGTKEVVERVEPDGTKRTNFAMNYEGGLLDTDLFIGDELFKASSASLNAALGALLRDEGRLMAFAGMSNELPSSQSLNAFWDRFPLRMTVPKLGFTSRKKLGQAKLSNSLPTLTSYLDRGDVVELQQRARSISIPNHVFDALYEVIGAVESQGIPISVRKDEQLFDCLKAYALVKGGTEVKLTDLKILRYSLWNNPDQQDQIDQTIAPLIVNQDDRAKADLRRLQEKLNTVVRKNDAKEALKFTSELEKLVNSINKGDRMSGCSADLKSKALKSIQSWIVALESVHDISF